MNTAKKSSVLLELNLAIENYEFTSSITTALNQAELELYSINETIESLKALNPECDKIDYILAACSGALCGIIDIFLVGKPSESSLGDMTDKWFANRTKDFAKLCGWNDDDSKPLSSAIRYLEEKFKIPYDQSGTGGAAKEIFELTPTNHHFKSLAHNPTLLGLFFSILDQFNNTSHFVSNGQLISLEKADDKFELKGHNISSKLFCGFVNWFGHIISDMSGSSGSKGRGMGIPSPLWTWSNDIIAIKNSLNIPVSQFNKNINALSINLFEQGFDSRFQTIQAIPVFINELIIRLFYSIRRMINFFASTNKTTHSFKDLWNYCEPFSNPTIKRMLTVAHGSFCLIDLSDAVIRGMVSGAGSFNTTEFFLCLNIAGIGRFTISLYGEAKRIFETKEAEDEIYYCERKRLIIKNYIEGLNTLSVLYDDSELLNFIDNIKKSNLYLQTFEKSVELANKRKVPVEKQLKTKTDIDSYFKGVTRNG